MSNIQNDNRHNDQPRDRIRLWLEVLRASTPAIYCRSWVPYIRILLLVILVLLAAFTARLLLADAQSWQGVRSLAELASTDLERT